MGAHIFLVSSTIIVVFVLFLVITRTLNSTINLFVKLEYLLQKECDLKKEALAVRRLMEEQAAEQQEKQEKKEQLNEQG